MNNHSTAEYPRHPCDRIISIPYIGYDLINITASGSDDLQVQIDLGVPKILLVKSNSWRIEIESLCAALDVDPQTLISFTQTFNLTSQFFDSQYLDDLGLVIAASSDGETYLTCSVGTACAFIAAQIQCGNRVAERMLVFYARRGMRDLGLYPLMIEHLKNR